MKKKVTVEDRKLGLGLSAINPTSAGTSAAGHNAVERRRLHEARHEARQDLETNYTGSKGMGRRGGE